MWLFFFANLNDALWFSSISDTFDIHIVLYGLDGHVYIDKFDSYSQAVSNFVQRILISITEVQRKCDFGELSDDVLSTPAIQDMLNLDLNNLSLQFACDDNDLCLIVE